MKPTLTSGSVSVAKGATLSRCGHSVCNAHFASLPLAYELTNSHLSLKISPLEIFSASSPEFSGREKKRDVLPKVSGRGYKEGCLSPLPGAYAPTSPLKGEVKRGEINIINN